MRDREATIRRYWTEIWTHGRFDLVDQVYAPAYRENLETATPSAFAAGAAAWRAHFTDFRVEIDELFSVGDRVITRVTYYATHTGDFKFMPATGRTCQVSGIDIFEFVGDRVVQHWHETDHLELFRQLGAELRAAPD